MRKYRIFSAAAVFRTLCAFIIYITAVTEVMSIARGSVQNGLLVSMLPMALAAVAAMLISRISDNKLIISLAVLIPPAFAWLISGDLVLMICNMAVAAAVSITAIVERVRLSKEYKDTSDIQDGVIGMVSLLVLYVVTLMPDVEGLGRMVFNASLVYIILTVAAILFERLELNLISFEKRSAQPVGIIRRNVRSYITTAVLLVAAVALLMPYGEDTSFSLIKDVLSLIAAAIYMVINILDKLFGSLVSYSDGGAVSDADSYIPPVEVSDGNPLLDAIIYGVGIMLAAAFAGYILFIVIRAIVRAVRKGYADRQLSDTECPDTVERITAARREQRQPLIRRMTNAERVREIYRRAVEGMAKYGVKVLPGDTPDDICRAVRESGFDIAELTALYKQARYMRECPDDVLKRARAAKPVRLEMPKK